MINLLAMIDALNDNVMTWVSSLVVLPTTFEIYSV